MSESAVEPVKIAIVGAAGRMGRMLVAEVMGREGCVLSGATDHADSPHIGQDAGELAGAGTAGVALMEDAAQVIAGADAVIDFTTPAATEEHARLAAQAGCALIVGTTGMAPEQEGALDLAARHVPVVYAPNYSVGVTLMMELTRKVAATLSEDWDIEVLEMHHRHKVDAPSGTALGLGRAAADGRGVDHDEKKQAVRDGHTGPRMRGDIGYATLRGGDVVGEHTVMFAGEAERVELTHKAGSRQIFAGGAVHAALWSRGKTPAVYDMVDVLGLRD